ncbi:Caveolin-3 [Mactra antiquata]
MSNGREADMTEPMSVEIALDDRESRKSSTSTSSFEDLNTLRLAKGRRQSGQSYNSARSLEPATVQVEVVPARKQSGSSIAAASPAALKKSSNIEEPTEPSPTKASKSKGKGSKKDASPKKAKATKTKDKKEKVVKPKRNVVMDADRDPGNVNGIVKIKFEEIFAEPEGAYSFGTIWGATYRVFTDSKVWCYKFMSAMCGVPCALCWGLHFACLSFCQIWCNQPTIRSFSIQVKPLQKVYVVLVESFIEPCFESLGKMFSSIRIQNTKLTVSPKEVAKEV